MCTKSPSKSYKSKRVNLAQQVVAMQVICLPFFCGNQATWGRSENARMSLIFSRGFVDHDYDEEGGNWGVKNVFRLSDSSSSVLLSPLLMRPSKKWKSLTLLLLIIVAVAITVQQKVIHKPCGQNFGHFSLTFTTH